MSGRPIKIVLGLGAAAVIVTGLFFLLKDSSIFEIKKVTVSGLTGIRAGRVRAATLGQSSIDFDESAVRSAAAGKPPVKSLKVETSIPDKATVSVVLYEPVAAVGLRPGAAEAVAADGSVLPGLATAGLPFVQSQVSGGKVTDATALDDLSILSAAPAALRGRITGVGRDRTNGIYASLAGGPRIYFGDISNARAKWAAATVVLEPA